jgi:hypothetical protein
MRAVDAFQLGDEKHPGADDRDIRTKKQDAAPPPTKAPPPAKAPPPIRAPSPPAASPASPYPLATPPVFSSRGENDEGENIALLRWRDDPHRMSPDGPPYRDGTAPPPRPICAYYSLSSPRAPLPTIAPPSPRETSPGPLPSQSEIFAAGFRAGYLAHVAESAGLSPGQIPLGERHPALDTPEETGVWPEETGVWVKHWDSWRTGK